MGQGTVSNCNQYALKCLDHLNFHLAQKISRETFLRSREITIPEVTVGLLAHLCFKGDAGERAKGGPFGMNWLESK